MLTQEDFRELYLPHFPLVSNDFAREGQYRVPRVEAFTKLHIETIAPKRANLITADFDVEQAEWHIKDLVAEGTIPEPSFITSNRLTEHAHVGWFIDGFVSTEKSLAFFSDVSRMLKAVSGSDLAYTGKSVRNPMSPVQATAWGTDHLYTLNELNAYRGAYKASQAASASTVECGGAAECECGGRNIHIFHSLRRYAYRIRRHYTDFTLFQAALYDRALELRGGDFTFPITEVQSITSSVSKWVWKTFTPEAFARIQSARSRKRAVVQAAPGRYTEALAYIEAGFTLRETADSLGLSYEAAKKLVQRARKQQGEKK